jgi:hypothetical protein
MPLSEALALRQSDRANLRRSRSPAEMLSSLLWSAAGVNRPGTGKRTAPTARNWQEIDVYVAMESGLYRYDAVRMFWTACWRGTSAKRPASRSSWPRRRRS